MSTKQNVPSTYFWEANKYKELEYTTKTSSGTYNETSTTSGVTYSGNDGTQGLFNKLAVALANYTISATDFNYKPDYNDPVLTSFKNKIINGNFDVWQRGTSQTSNGYGSDDRWKNVNVGTTKLHTQQPFTLGQTDVPNNPKYYSRTVVTSVAGTSNYCTKYQLIEGVSNSSGKTFEFSFYAKADSTKNISIEFAQSFGTGGSPSATVTGIGIQKIQITSSWVKYTTNVTFPSVSGKTVGSNNNDWYGVFIWFDAGSDFNARTNFLGQQSGTFDIAQVQLEEGSVATKFEDKPFSVELGLCQRYYEKSYNIDITLGTASIANSIISVATSNNVLTTNGRFKTTKRVTPFIQIYSTTGVAGKVAVFTSQVDIPTADCVAAYVGQDTICVVLSPSSPFSVGTAYSYHYTADSEL